MKRFKRIIATLLATTMYASMLTACTKANCKATTAIAFKAYCGYAHSIYAVGGTVTMELSFKVTSEDDNITPVKAVLSIPNVDNIEAKYKNGQEIPCKYKSMKNVATYEFSVDASKDSEMQECIIKFMPIEEGTVTVKFDYDGHVDSSCDVSRELTFKEGEFLDNTDEHTPDYDGVVAA